MKRRSLLFGVAFAFGLVTLPVHVSSAVPAEVSESAVEGSSARIKACRDAATKKGDVKVDILFVIDTSMSLRDSDPFGKTIRDPARVRAMESVVSILGSDLSDDTENSDATSAVKIRLNFLDFGSSVRPSFGVSDWQRIDDFDSQSLKSFGSKDDDPDTDYVGALIDADGVVDVLAQAARESDCQIVLWFTDGKFDFDPKTGVGSRSFSWLEAELGAGRGVVRDRTTASAARAAGEKLLCNSGVSRPRAVADDLRELDKDGALTVIGVGLNTTNTADNFAVLRRLLEGKDCGLLDPVGFLVEVKSADDLAAAMRRAIFGGPPPPPPVCDISTVGPGASFYIAEPVRRADLFLRARERVSEIQLVRLSGSKAAVITLFKDGAVRPVESIEGIRVSTTQLDDIPTFETTLQFSSPTEQWVGDWVLRACNESGLPAEIDADLVIRGCIAFDLAAGYDRIVVGRSSSLFLMLKRCGEDASRLSTVTALTLSATMLIDGKRVDAVLAENETLLEVPFAPTEESLGGSASKRIKLQVIEVNATYEVLSGSRPVVLEWSKDNSVFDISLVAPPNTPYVELVSCRDIVERTRSAVCEFKATAKDAVGRVSTEGARILPGAVLGDGVVIRASSSTRFPLTVRPGSPETFTFTFDLEGVRKNERVATQSFEVEFSYETDGEPVETGVVSGEFAVEPNLSVSVDYVKALLRAMLGLFLALAVFVLARILAARIQIPEGGMLWIATFNLSQTDAEVARAALLGEKLSASSLPLQSSTFGVRRVDSFGPLFDSGSYLRARAGWRLLSELGFVEVSASSKYVFSSGKMPAKSQSGRVSLNLVKEWWLVSDWQGDGTANSPDELKSQIMAAPSRLVIVTTGADTPRILLEDFSRRIETSLPDQIANLAESMWQKPADVEALEGPPMPPVPEI
jgi:hypothetical protein